MPEITSKLTEVFIFKRVDFDFKFLLLKRHEHEIYPGIWSIAGGRVGKNEKAYQAAIREMQEETGLTAKHFYLIDMVNFFYDSRKDIIHLVPVFLAEVNDGEVILSEEHSEYLWSSIEEAYDKIFWLSWKNNISLIYKILKDEKLFRTLEEIKS